MEGENEKGDLTGKFKRKEEEERNIDSREWEEEWANLNGKGEGEREGRKGEGGRKGGKSESKTVMV